MVKGNPDLNENTVERLTSSLRRMQEADSANKEQPRHSSREDQLAQAKASRSQAETARQKIANEILEATKGVCQKLIADGEQTVERAKTVEAEAQQKQQETQAELEKAKSTRAEAQSYAEKVKSEAEKKAQEMLDQTQAIRVEADAYREKVMAEAQQQAQEQLDQAQNIRYEADAYREKVMAEVQQQAQEQLDQTQNIRHEADAYLEKVITEAKEQGKEILYLARSSTEQECKQMKDQASLEAQQTIAEAELIKAAAQEELEAQRIYAEAARLETESLEVLAQVRARSGEQPVSSQVESQWEGAALQSSGIWKSKELEDESPSVERRQAPNPEEEAGVRPVKRPRSRRSKVSSEKE